MNFLYFRKMGQSRHIRQSKLCVCPVSLIPELITKPNSLCLEREGQKLAAPSLCRSSRYAHQMGARNHALRLKAKLKGLDIQTSVLLPQTTTADASGLGASRCREATAVTV